MSLSPSKFNEILPPENVDNRIVMLAIPYVKFSRNCIKLLLEVVVGTSTNILKSFKLLISMAV